MIGAVDIGGTKFAVGIVSETGSILARAESPSFTERGPEAGIANIVQMLRETLAQSGGTLRGIGIGGKSFTIGLVLCQSPEQIFTDAFLPQVILGVEQAAIQQGFHVLLKPVDPQDTGGYARLIAENHVDGILLSGPRQDDLALMNLHQQHVPLLLMGQLPGTDIPFVDVNATAGAELAVNHLIEHGHRYIGIITNAPLDYTSAQQRRDGYLPIDQALIKEGNCTPEGRCPEVIQVQCARFSFVYGGAAQAVQKGERSQLQPPMYLTA